MEETQKIEETQKSAVKKFTQGYTFKILMLILLVLLLLIPLWMIRGMIDERRQTANSAEADIMEAWGKQLLEAGPLLTIPGVRTEEVRTKTDRDGEKIEIINVPFILTIAPQKLGLAGNFKTEIRRRGIFSVPLFSGELELTGNFEPAPALASLRSNEELFLNQAELLILLSSQKGIRKINQAQWKGRELFFQPGNRGFNIASFNRSSLNSGMYAALGEAEGLEGSFAINIAIQGGQYVRFLPAGQDTHITISADWGSPSFQGAFLPNQANIRDSGFDAVWDISYLSRDIPLFWKTEGGLSGMVLNSSSSSRDASLPAQWRADGTEWNFSDSLFGLNFYRAVNAYSLNTRAVKYALLFLIVPFLTLFLLEVFTGRRIHPVPYLLSGIGNVVFYLLLLSLSEQMRFYLAYLLSAAAVTIMLTLYSRSLLPSWNKSWYMGLVALLSYVLLYAVLNAESYALLIGSIGAFVVVALVMFLTRKLDWYGQDKG
ncbi:MAG: cell envelope integrity protein CreD [Spirochaetaceae bacterium]|jgi:inner membrane protein|nr:cell envelope integrity protein CreD [Spirochaetaceae bacterium]